MQKHKRMETFENNSYGFPLLFEQSGKYGWLPIRKFLSAGILTMKPDHARSKLRGGPRCRMLIGFKLCDYISDRWTAFVV